MKAGKGKSEPLGIMEGASVPKSSQAFAVMQARQAQSAGRQRQGGACKLALRQLDVT